MLKEKFRKNLCFIVAMKGDEVVAGTFNVVKAGKFYGRYWGTFDSSVGFCNPRLTEYIPCHLPLC